MATSLSRRSPSAVHPTREQLDDLDALLKRMLDLPVNRLEDESGDEEDEAPEAWRGQETAPQQRETAPQQPTATDVAEPMRGPHRPAFSRSSEGAAAAPRSFQYNTPHPNEADLKPRIIIVAPNAPENATNSAAEAAVLSPPQPAMEKQIGDRPEDWVPLTSSWQPSARTWKPLTEAWRQAQGGREEGKSGRGEEETRKNSVVEPMVPSHESIDSPVPLSSPFPLLNFSVSQESTAAPRPTPPTPAPEWTPWYCWPLVGFNAAFDLCLEPWGPIGRWLRGPTGRALLGILGLLCLTAAAALAAAEWIGWTS